MAQVHQATPLNGGISEKNGNGLNHDESASTAATATAMLQPNGAVHLISTPTKDHPSTSMETDDLQLSPGDLRRRSTRASALKAQEKIKLKDDIVQGPQKRTGMEELENSMDELEGIGAGGGPGAEKKKMGMKKRKLESGSEFDQTCFRFGLRANDDGDVYAMTDESENSSIHESEMEIVRWYYEKMKNREPDEEQLLERQRMRREAEAALREEETKLLVLRKMKDSQGRAINKLAAETKAADLAEAQAAVAAAAYRPVQAKGSQTNGKSSLAVTKAAIAGLQQMPIPQQMEMLQRLSTQSPAAKQAYQLAKKNPSQTANVFAQLITWNHLNNQDNKDNKAFKQQFEAMDLVKQVQQQQQQQQTPQNQNQPPKIHHHQQQPTQTPAQRAAAARIAFRTQADKQLMTIPLQKQQPHDITFLPNANATAFTALHGLDNVVSFMQKDEAYFQPYRGPLYECEECHTDCAPTWKAIGSTPDDLHLYCENCVQLAQKRKNRADQTSLLKRAFQKICAQEKEFDKKIAEGQLEQFVEQKPQVVPATPQTQNIPSSSTATVSSTPLSHSGLRIGNMPSSSGTSTPTHAIKTSTPLPSTPKSSSAKKATSSSNNQQQAQMQMMANLMRNPQMMQQMAQMMMFQQAAAGNNMQMMIAQAALQAQAAQAQAAQQQAQQAAARAKAEAAKREKELAAQAAQQAAQQQAAQQQQQQLLMAAIMQMQSNPQMMAQLSKLTPSQQKQFQEMLLKQGKK